MGRNERIHGWSSIVASVAHTSRQLASCSGVCTIRAIEKSTI
jgi:hypothetical protein